MDVRCGGYICVCDGNAVLCHSIPGRFLASLMRSSHALIDNVIDVCDHRVEEFVFCRSYRLRRTLRLLLIGSRSKNGKKSVTLLLRSITPRTITKLLDPLIPHLFICNRFTNRTMNCHFRTHGVPCEDACFRRHLTLWTL